MPAPQPDQDEVYLIVNDRIFSGWESVKVRRSVEAVAGAFDLTISDRWADLSEPWPIFVGDECAVKFGKETVILGYVDDVSTDEGAGAHTMTVSGRDKTADIVDCSVTAKEYSKQKLEAIARDQCATVGVSVSVQASTGGAIDKFATQPGETILEALARAAKGKRVLLTSNAKGELAITKAGVDKVGVTLEMGVNIKKITVRTSGKERFTKYVVLGQVDGDRGGAASWGVEGRAADKYLKRTRPLVIVADDTATQAYVGARAAWEAKTRAGKASTVVVVVQGWRTPDGLLWRPNSLVPVKAKRHRVDGELVISDIEYSLGDDGTTATMTLKRRDAYTDEVDLPTNLDPVDPNIVAPADRRALSSLELNRSQGKTGSGLSIRGGGNY